MVDISELEKASEDNLCLQGYVFFKTPVKVVYTKTGGIFTVTVVDTNPKTAKPVYAREMIHWCLASEFEMIK